MNREETKAAIKVMQAFVDGEEVRHRGIYRTCLYDPTWS